MRLITPAQMRKIHALARERGIDGDILHEHVFIICNKNSLKDLTIMEAVRVIDSLEGKVQTGIGMMTEKQRRFIEGLAIGLGWITGNGKVDLVRLKCFVKERFMVDDLKWVDAKTASKVIEALKQMNERERKAAI